MQGASQTALTPAGVRDGNPAALAGLVERRSAAVLQFCEAVCEPDDARLAAAEAFARFRAAVAAADDPGALNPEALLMSATRHAAAGLARISTRPHGVRGLLTREHDSELCAEVPRLLAARADRMLDPSEQHMLAVHLEQDPGCRAIEAAWGRAERAYRSPRPRELPAEVQRELLAALAGAAPLVGPEAGELEHLLADAPLAAPEPVEEPEPEPPIDEAPPAAVEPVEEPEPEPLPEPEPEPAEEPEPVLDEAAAAAVEPVDEPEPLPEPEPEPTADEPEPTQGPAGVGLQAPVGIRKFEGPPPPAPAEEPPPAERVPAEPPAAEPAPAEENEELDPQAGTGWVIPGARPRAERPTTQVVRRRRTHAQPQAPAGLPRTRRRMHLPHPQALHPHLPDHGPVYRLILPGTAVVLAIIIILAIAGVFGGGGPAPT